MFWSSLCRGRAHPEQGEGHCQFPCLNYTECLRIKPPELRAVYEHLCFIWVYLVHPLASCVLKEFFFFFFFTLRYFGMESLMVIWYFRNERETYTMENDSLGNALHCEQFRQSYFHDHQLHGWQKGPMGCSHGCPPTCQQAAHSSVCPILAVCVADLRNNWNITQFSGFCVFSYLMRFYLQFACVQVSFHNFDF